MAVTPYCGTAQESHCFSIDVGCESQGHVTTITVASGNLAGGR